jgi:phage terminase large subunit-like protein
MTMAGDDLEEGPDANQIRRHAKKMLSVREYNMKYRRIDFYKPHPKQVEAHASVSSEFMLRAGNQTGKSTFGAAQTAFALLDMYPEWYQGRRHEIPNILRSHEFVAWAAGPTSEMTRDVVQMKLLGDLSQKDGLGTGLIPLDSLCGSRPSMARGISHFADSVTIQRETGGNALLSFKTYAQGRQSFQGSAVDLAWLDEDIGRDAEAEAIYQEVLARLATTKGRVICTMTPVIGLTPLRKRFREYHPDRSEVLMSLHDALHIDAEEREKIIGRYRESDRATRVHGADMQGEGAVFSFAKENISHTMDPASVPPHWPWLWGVDFSHAGLSAGAHPFAAVLAVWDRDTDTIYIMDAIRISRALAANHVERIKATPVWDAPVAWPHDGHRAGILDGQALAAAYRKLGLNMRPTHATHAKSGGYGFEQGITDMENRFASGRLKIAKHLTDWWSEYLDYHREGGLVVKMNDDLMSATRIACMDIRYAKVLTVDGSGGYVVRRSQQSAPPKEWDIFTGEVID